MQLFICIWHILALCYYRLHKHHDPNPAKNNEDRQDYHPNPQSFIAKQVVQKKEHIKTFVAFSRHIEYPFPSTDGTDEQ